MEPKHRIILLWFSLLIVASLLRILLSFHPGLWADEIFSLAMATGHSLEHPADEANQSFGDYIESAEPQSASSFRRYLQHDSSPAGPGRVIRAVLLSDTSPPFYYLILNLWTRIFGTSDPALRLFSTLWAMACFPLLWSLGFELGGRRVAWASGILFAFSPLALYYSTEGRMYSLVWFLALWLALLTVALSRRGPRPLLISGWILSASLGLLTHYFFAFALAPCFVWIFLYPKNVSRLHCVGLLVITALIVLPWYLQLPETFSRWRVTKGWLDHPLTWKAVIVNPMELAWSYFSISGIWGRSRKVNLLAFGIYLSLFVMILRMGLGPLFTERWRMVWFWMLGCLLGPLVLDLLQGTNTSSVTRYALPGFPAAILLMARGLSVFPRRAYFTILILIPVIWLPGVRNVYAEPSRVWEDFPEVSNRVSAWAEPDDLIIVHSIPSGVLGVARYAHTTTPILSWVVQLGKRRVPEDMEKLVDLHSRVALVKVHDQSEPSPAQEWLLQHFKLLRTELLHPVSKAEILYFTR